MFNQTYRDPADLSEGRGEGVWAMEAGAWKIQSSGYGVNESWVQKAQQGENEDDGILMGLCGDR